MKYTITNKSELILFYLLVLGGIVVNYLLPSNVFSFLYFYPLLIIFYHSKNNYFWGAFILVLIDAPGAFFPHGELNYGLPMLRFPALISYQELFIYVAFLKSIRIKATTKFIYYKPLLGLFVFMILLFIISYAHGITGPTFLKSIKWLLPWSLLYSIPRLISTGNDWEKFFKLIFPVVFISFGTQIFHLIFGVPPAFMLGRDFVRISGEMTDDSNNMMLYTREFRVFRLLGSYFIAILSIISSMFYLTAKNTIFSKNYLSLVLLFSLLTLFMSGTRGFILATSITLLIFILFIYHKPEFYIKAAMIGSISALFLISFSFISDQLNAVLSRFSTLILLLKGDPSAGGSLNRLDIYTPILLKQFYESPIFGWGFSDHFWSFSNGHAGFANLLAHVGIVGMLFFSYFWWKLITVPIEVNKRLSSTNKYKKSILVLILGFLIFFVLHNTSGQMFQYLIGYYNFSFSQLLFYCFSHTILTEALAMEKQNVLP